MIAVDLFTETLRVFVWASFAVAVLVAVVVGVALTWPRRSPESPHGCEDECPQCEGSGSFVVVFSYGPVDYDCDHCDGHGRVVVRHCAICELRP